LEIALRAMNHSVEDGHTAAAKHQTFEKSIEQGVVGIFRQTLAAQVKDRR
jgi:hypothetical protein